MAQSNPRTVKPSVGIDLGTTYSCVAVFQNGRPEVIANSQGNRITPSVVAFTEEGRLIGEGAEIQRKLDPPNAIYNAKRFIGRTWDDPAVQRNCSMYPFKVLEKNKMVQFQVESGPKTLSLIPEEVGAAILGKMKKIAEDYIEETVEDVVVTVPAYFTDSQRQATVNAGKIAGLNITRIINEPTAAAMAYGLREGTKEDEGKRILVYDLGGGTFDVSVLEIEEDLIQVKATAGNTNLGGEDFNDLLVKYFQQEILRKHKFDLTSNHKAIRRLTGACEKIKRNLSAEKMKESKLELDSFLPNGQDFISSLTRAKFENLCKELFDETIKCVEQALQDAQLSKEDIDEIVLVGGSSRIPKLQSMLSTFFKNKTLSKSINPDEAVACGAAVQAAIINNDPHLSVKDLLLMDVLPLSIGETLAGGITSIVLERNTTIPVRRKVHSKTMKNNQTSALFEITEGERTMSKDNKILGAFVISGLPPRKEGEVKFESVFEIDENGILTVSATLIGTNKKGGITLDVKSSGRMSDEEVNRLVQEAEKMKYIDQMEENRVLAMNKLTSLCNHVSFVSQDLTDTDVGVALKCVEECLAWIGMNPKATLEEYTSKYNYLRDKTENVIKLSEMEERSVISSKVLRLSKQTATYYLKRGHDLFLSNDGKDKKKAAEYFYKAYKIACEKGNLSKEIEALMHFGHVNTDLAATNEDEQLKIKHALRAIKGLAVVLALDKNKTLSDDNRKAVIEDLQMVSEEFFKVIENLKDKDKFFVLDVFMRGLDRKKDIMNPTFGQIVLQCRLKEIKLFLKKVETCLANEDIKAAQNYIQTVNYPKERARLLAKSPEEKKQLTDVIDLIQRNMMQAEGLNQINLAANLLDGAHVDHPDTFDKALMSLDHLSEAKHLTRGTQDQIFIKAHFFEGKVFMDYIPNTLKSEACFEKVITASEQKDLDTEEYREAKYILEQLRKEKFQVDSKSKTTNREEILNELQQDLQKITTADNYMSDQKFADFLFSEYPPKHKQNCKKPVFTTNESKKKAYLRLSMFYHPDKVDSSTHGEKYKALCGEIAKYINGRFMKM